MKIFVGHSFAESDKSLVDAIISFLAKKGMSCQTGERAQNKSVSDKVKARIDNNEVFLGIFTVDQQIKRADEVEVPKSFIAKFIPAKKSAPKVNPPIFTTSNWVLQESGYAIAKEKQIILMVENGIYKFPELQGDKEYIPFDRKFLDEPFLKLSDMLDAIKSGDFGMQGASASTSPIGEQANKEEVDSTKTTLMREMLDAHKNGEIKTALDIYNLKIRPTLEGSNKIFWDAVTLRWGYCSGDADKLIELEKLFDEGKQYEAGFQVGICYDFVGKFDIARNAYKKCLEATTDDSQRVSCYLKISNSYSEEENYDEAINVLLGELNNPTFNSFKERMFKKLVRIAEKKQDDYLYLLFAEKALDINPVNTDLRFDLAYKYSKNDNNELALFHYKKLLDMVEHEMGLNNIGVAYSNLDMQSKGVKFYEKASIKKNTLANANLAYKYMNAGFSELAENLLRISDELSKEGIEVHEKIGYAKKALKEKIEGENKIEAEVLTKASKLHRFRIRHSEAYCEQLNNVLDFSGKWLLGEWGEIDISWNRKDGSFIAKDSRDIVVPSSGLGLGYVGLLNAHLATTTIKTRVVELNGSIHNLAGTYALTVKETVKGSTTPSILSSGLDEVFNSTGLIIVNVSGNLIDVMEEVKNKERTFNQYRRV